MTTYRVIWTPGVFPKWRDFPNAAEVETYRARMSKHDPDAEVVELEGGTE